MRTDVYACDCPLGLCGHRKRACTQSWCRAKKKTLPHRGLEPASVKRPTFQSDALPPQPPRPLLRLGVRNFRQRNPHLLPVHDAACSLLTVATGKLVSNLRRLHRAHSDLAELVALVVNGQHHLTRGQGERLGFGCRPHAWSGTQVQSSRVLLYSVRRKTWVPRMNYKQGHNIYMHKRFTVSRVHSSIQAWLKVQVLFKQSIYEWMVDLKKFGGLKSKQKLWMLSTHWVKPEKACKPMNGNFSC